MRRSALLEVRTHHLTTSRTARYCTIGEPGPAVRELWLACHGYGQLAADFAAALGALEDPVRLVVAPEALSRFYVSQEQSRHGPDSAVGATWMTREDRLTEIDDYVAYLDRVHSTVLRELEGPLRVVALGFSQGTATISRWSARTDARVDELVLWGGRLAPELDLGELRARWAKLRVTLIAGSRDRWTRVQELQEEAAKLTRHGIAVGISTFEGGHRLDDDTLRALSRHNSR